MTTGSMYYLAMVVVVMVIFSLVMAYESWKQSGQGREMTLLPTSQNPDSDQKNTAGAFHA